MEESGLDGAVNLIKKLFNNRPGEDKTQKKKIKEKCKKGIMERQRGNTKKNENQNSSINPEQCNVAALDQAQSDETLYQKAVQSKRASSSSEDGLDLSDESNLFNNLVLDTSVQRESRLGLPSRDNVQQPEQTAGAANHDPDPTEIGDTMVQQSERAKAAMVPPKGELPNNLNINPGEFDKPVLSVKELLQMDQDYIVVGSHVDQNLQEKIVTGAYIDFSKLLPKDRLMTEEEGRMDLVVRNGKAFWMPVSEGVAINNFSKWEQAFRVFARVRNPVRDDITRVIVWGRVT